MGLYYYLSILIVIATIFSYINARFLKLPSSIGIMLIAILFSLSLVLIGNVDSEPLNNMYDLIRHINFTNLLMGGMLYFLLFAGAIQININDLKEEKLPIIIFSTLSVIISTFVVGFVLYYSLVFLLPLVGINASVSLLYCLLFGALISPTDPVAVLSILKEAKVPKPLETKVTGEALFNDGVAVIAFTVIYSLAQGSEQIEDITFFSITWLLVKEVFGALFVGISLGALAFYAIKTANDAKLTVLITISVVIAGYMLSQSMNISGPLTMVAAGIIVGNAGRKHSRGRSEEINFVKTFWELVDDILNAILFLLIGLELLLIPNLNYYWLAGIISIIVVLFARYVSIKIPTMVIPSKEKYSKGTIFILVWGGLRGGVSIALALSITDTAHRNSIVAITYFVVVFSILVQGLSVGKIAKRIDS